MEPSRARAVAQDAGVPPTDREPDDTSRPPRDITERSTVRGVLAAFPAAEAIFDRHGLVGCGGPSGPLEPIGFFARVHQVDPDALLAELNAFIAGGASGFAPPPGDTSGLPLSGGPEPDRGAGAIRGRLPMYPAAPVHAAEVYPPFLVASLGLALGAGLLLGLAALWQVSIGLRLAVDWTALVEAHGNLQVFGFAVLFVAGVSLHAVPRFRGHALEHGRVILAIVPLVGGGALLRAVGQIGGLPALVVASAALEAAGLSLLAWVLLVVLDVPVSRRRAGSIAGPGSLSVAPAPPRPRRLREAWEPWLLWGIGWLLLAGLLNLALAVRLAVSGAAWTPPELEDPFLAVVFFGFVASFIFGVALRTLPVFMGLPPTRFSLVERARRCWQVGVLVSVLGGLVAALLRPSAEGGARSLAELPALGGAALELAGLVLFIAATGTWEVRTRSEEQRELPGQFRWFVRTGMAWLALGLVLIMALEAGAIASGTLPEFARVQASRHAIALGFVTQLMLGMASRIVPVFRGRLLRWIPILWFGYAALNLGALLRVVPEYVAGYAAPTDPLLAASGALAFVGIAACAAVLARSLVGRSAPALEDVPIARHTPGSSAVGVASAVPIPDGALAAEASFAADPAAVSFVPERHAGRRQPDVEAIGPDTNVGWLLESWPEALPTLLDLGFAPLADPAMRARLTSSVSLDVAAAIEGMQPEELVDRLRVALGHPNRSGEATGRVADDRPASSFTPPATPAPDSDPRRLLALGALRTVLDPEIPLNVIDLGLIRGLSLDGAVARVSLTLTFPGCPSGPFLQANIEDALRQIPGVEKVDVEFGFEPPWSFDEMTLAGRAALGLA